MADEQTLNNITTFGTVEVSDTPLVLKGTMSGVTEFGGDLILDDLSSSATITNIGNNSEITLRATENNGAYTFSKLTVANICDGKTLNIQDRRKDV